MIPTNNESILEFLQDLKMDVELQKETEQVLLHIKVGDNRFPLFIRLFEGSPLLQLLVFIPCTLKGQAFSDLARLLHLLNKELDMPGFGMDEKAKVVYYRLMLPTNDELVSSSLLRDYLHVIQNVCETFAPVVAAVATGSSSYNEILSKLKEHSAKK